MDDHQIQIPRITTSKFLRLKKRWPGRSKCTLVNTVDALFQARMVAWDVKDVHHSLVQMKTSLRRQEIGEWNASSSTWTLGVQLQGHLQSVLHSQTTSYLDDLRNRQRLLIFRLVNTINREQECSHRYTSVFWSLFSKYLKDAFPSLANKDGEKERTAAETFTGMTTRISRKPFFTV